MYYLFALLLTCAIVITLYALVYAEVMKQKPLLRFFKEESALSVGLLLFSASMIVSVSLTALYSLLTELT